ncbi:LOW QUALITY PROTEIN: hypothetical protein MC885_011955 [Smutsia gigantea]|nr:LOW QUALITY PROTEIN: hypothetical protein MC885_011955 [Smutsia gigantea]
MAPPAELVPQTRSPERFSQLICHLATSLPSQEVEHTGRGERARCPWDVAQGFSLQLVVGGKRQQQPPGAGLLVRRGAPGATDREPPEGRFAGQVLGKGTAVGRGTAEERSQGRGRARRDSGSSGGARPPMAGEIPGLEELLPLAVQPQQHGPKSLQRGRDRAASCRLPPPVGKASLAVLSRVGRRRPPRLPSRSSAGDAPGHRWPRPATKVPAEGAYPTSFPLLRPSAPGLRPQGRHGGARRQKATGARRLGHGAACPKRT